jgi:carbon starvation protein CstA
VASPTDSYGKWLGDILLATLVGLLLLNTLLIFIVKDALDVRAYGLFDLGMFVFIAILFGIVGLFRTRKQPGPYAGMFCAISVALYAVTQLVDAYGQFHSQHSWKWLRIFAACSYLAASVFMLYSVLKKRKSKWQTQS